MRKFGYFSLYRSKGSNRLTPEYGSHVGSSKSSHLTRKKYLDNGCVRVSPAGRWSSIVSTTYSSRSAAAILVNSGIIFASSNHEVLKTRQSSAAASLILMSVKFIRSNTGCVGSLSLLAITRKGPIQRLLGFPEMPVASFRWMTKSPSLKVRNVFLEFSLFSSF